MFIADCLTALASWRAKEVQNSNVAAPEKKGGIIKNICINYQFLFALFAVGVSVKYASCI